MCKFTDTGAEKSETSRNGSTTCIYTLIEECGNKLLINERDKTCAIFSNPYQNWEFFSLIQLEQKKKEW